MTRLFIKIFFLLCLTAVAVAAQAEKNALPVVTETETIVDLKPLIAAAKKNKQPLLINFWATWCGPCRYEFPELVKIDAEYRPRGLDFAIVSLDNIGSKDMLVAGFLNSYRSTMRSFLFDSKARGGINGALRQIAPQTRGGLPLTLLFNAKGKLVYQKDGVIDAKILRAKLETVMPKTAAKTQNQPRKSPS
jgi:thiol-disulfide isomerase/thioredoxin